MILDKVRELMIFCFVLFFPESCSLDSDCSDDRKQNHSAETGEMLLHLLSLATVKQREVQQFRDA